MKQGELQKMLEINRKINAKFVETEPIHRGDLEKPSEDEMKSRGWWNTSLENLIVDGKKYPGHADMIGKACRDLETGTLHVYRDGKLAFRVNIDSRKEKCLREPETGWGMYWVKYTEPVAWYPHTDALDENTSIPTREEKT